MGKYGCIIQVHVLNNLELPMITNVGNPIPIKRETTTNIAFTMQDTFNDAGVKNVAVEHRGCRFSDETQPNNLFDIYSSHSCYLEVRLRLISTCKQHQFSFRLSVNH